MDGERATNARAAVEVGLQCPDCGEPWLRPTNLAGRYRCGYCLHRFELTSVCPNFGEHSTIVRMTSTAMLQSNNCIDSMLHPICPTRRGSCYAVCATRLRSSPWTSAGCGSRSVRFLMLWP